MRDVKNRPVIDFTVPDDCPPSVAKADRRYRDLVDQLAKHREEHREATEAIEKGHQLDVKAMATAMRGEGEQPSDEGEHERAAREKAESVARQLEAAEVAVDEAGDAVVEAIDAAKASWLDDLRSETAAAEGVYAEAIAQARQAIENLGSKRHVVQWLAEFRPHMFQLGKAPTAPSRHLFYSPVQSYELRVPSAGVRAADVFDDEVEAMPLLDALASAAAGGEPTDA